MGYGNADPKVARTHSAEQGHGCCHSQSHFIVLEKWGSDRCEHFIACPLVSCKPQVLSLDFENNKYGLTILFLNKCLAFRSLYYILIKNKSHAKSFVLLVESPQTGCPASFSSVQDGIKFKALGKAHMGSTPSLISFPNVAFKTVSFIGFL